jgi:hypothetical protein
VFFRKTVISWSNSMLEDTAYSALGKDLISEVSPFMIPTEAAPSRIKKALGSPPRRLT